MNTLRLTLYITAGVIVGFILFAVLGFFGVSPGILGVVSFAAVLVFCVLIVQSLRSNKKVHHADAGTRAAALRFEPVDGHARLYIIRASGIYAKAQGVNVLVDDTLVCQLKSPRFVAVTLEPGTHRIAAGFPRTLLNPALPPPTTELTLSAGDVVAMQVTPRMGGIRVATEITRFDDLTKAQAKAKNAKMVLAEAFA